MANNRCSFVAFPFPFSLIQTGSPVRAKGQRSRTPVGAPSPGQSQPATTITVKGVEQKLVQIVMDEIVEGGARVNWTDIVGQEVSE